MKKQKSFILIQIIIIVVIIGGLAGWVKNIIKLSNCDFEAPYKAEVIHSIGVVVIPVGMITGWIDVGK